MRRPCATCGGEFYANRRSRKFCSVACRGRAHAGALNPNYKGGYLRRDGYWAITVNGRDVLFHRHVMAQHLGRALTRREVVHHRDGDPLNNAIENLELLDGQATHAKKHRGLPCTETEKQCSHCLQVKPIEQFARGGHGSGGRERFCKPCASIYRRARRSKQAD